MKTAKPEIAVVGVGRSGRQLISDSIPRFCSAAPKSAKYEMGFAGNLIFVDTDYVGMAAVPADERVLLDPRNISYNTCLMRSLEQAAVIVLLAHSRESLILNILSVIEAIDSRNRPFILTLLATPFEFEPEHGESITIQQQLDDASNAVLLIHSELILQRQRADDEQRRNALAIAWINTVAARLLTCLSPADIGERWQNSSEVGKKGTVAILNLVKSQVGCRCGFGYGAAFGNHKFDAALAYAEAHYTMPSEVLLNASAVVALIESSAHESDDLLQRMNMLLIGRGLSTASIVIQSRQWRSGSLADREGIVSISLICFQSSLSISSVHRGCHA